MAARRIIPCLDVQGDRVVKGVQFKNLQDAGDPVTLALAYSDQGADEVAYLDISATLEARRTFLGMVERTADVVTIPLTVGGGVRDVQGFRDLLLAGADKVAVNTAAVVTPDIIGEAADRFGSQCVVVAIDARRTEQGFRVCTHAGTRLTELEPAAWAARVEELGAGEILLTSMDADGGTAGYDVELTGLVADAVNVPVIASGGAGELRHFSEVLARTRAQAVLAASVFHYGVFTIGQVKTYLQEQGIEVRVVESEQEEG